MIGRSITEDFEPRVPRVDLVVFIVGFGLLGLALSFATRDELLHGQGSTSAVLGNMVIPWVFYLAGAAFVASILLLPLRLNFEEGGLRRRTLLGPRYVPWRDVRAAQITHVRGYAGLELRLNGWRWILIPLRGYGRPASLVDAIAGKLSIDILDSGRMLNQLREREACFDKQERS